MIVHVGSMLHSYTGSRSRVEASGRTVRAVLDDLDERYPGIKFRVVDEQSRIRPHVKMFVGQEPVRKLSHAVTADDELHILAALSGG